MPLVMSNKPAAAAAPMTEVEQAARVQLAAAYRVFDHLGWTEMIFNHITLRVPGPERHFLINPFGLHYREVTASNLVTVDLEGNPVRPSPYPINRAGFVIHSAIHRAVEEAHCVMHTHTTTGMSVACLQSGLSHDSFYGAQLKGRVAYHDFEGVTVNPDEQSRLLANVGDKKAVILRNGLHVAVDVAACLRHPDHGSERRRHDSARRKSLRADRARGRTGRARSLRSRFRLAGANDRD